MRLTVIVVFNRRTCESIKWFKSIAFIHLSDWLSGCNLELMDSIQISIYCIIYMVELCEI